MAENVFEAVKPVSYTHLRGQMSFNDLQAQEQPAEPAQATTPATNETQPAAGAEEQQPAPTLSLIHI